MSREAAVVAKRDVVTGAGYPLIESMRGIAALLIVANHVALLHPAPAGVQPFLAHLNIG